MTAAPREPSAREALAATLVVSLGVTALSYGLPSRHAATGVGLGFLAATWWLVLRRDDDAVRRAGLSLGGLLDPDPIEGARLAKSATIALGWALAAAALTFVPFFVGFRIYWHVSGPFLAPRALGAFADEALGQWLVVALPEEAFYRGYLQSTLDAAIGRRVRVLGAEVGPGLVASCALFALGHVLTEPHPARLAVFFPALLFGWLRARTGGIGASVAFHALCNVLSSTLARGYGLAS